MKNSKKIVLSGVLTAICVIGSLLTFPVLGSKCAPIQHFVNIACAVFLGKYYGVGVAFSASILRNALSLGSLMAFPGSMIGALLSGIIYRKTESIPMAAAGEIFGTGIIGGLLAYPVATFLMGIGGKLTFYVFVTPFLISTAMGSIIAVALLCPMEKKGILERLRKQIEL